MQKAQHNQISASLKDKLSHNHNNPEICRNDLGSNEPLVTGDMQAKFDVRKCRTEVQDSDSLSPNSCSDNYQLLFLNICEPSLHL